MLRLGLIVLASLSVLACSGSFKSPQQVLSTPPFTESKVEILASAVQEGAPVGFITGELAFKDVLLPKGTKLTVTFDTVCLKNHPQSEMEFSLPKAANLSQMRFYSQELSLSEDITSRSLKEQVDANPCVIGVSESSKVFLSTLESPGDPRRRFQRHLDYTHLTESFELFRNPNLPELKEVVIAVIDSGVDYEHEDLQGRMWTNERGEFGYNFYDKNPDPMDRHGHGTFVAGEIAAQNNNGIGISSPAGFHGRIMALKALGGDGHPFGTHETIANSIYYATDNGAEIINMSLGNWGYSRTQQLAIEYAIKNGVTLIVAAGNDFTEITWNRPYSPAIFGPLNKGMITVGAISLRDGLKSGFSNYSTEIVEIAAPGSSGIYSLLTRNTYGSKEGTSMATPLVSGAAALVIGFLKARGEEVSPELIEEIILDSSERSKNLTAYFQEGRSLNFMSLAEKLAADYDLVDVTLPEPKGPRLDAGILEEVSRGNSVLVTGFVCNSELDPAGKILVQIGQKTAPLKVSWNSNFAWQGECQPGHIMQHLFTGEYVRGHVKATYHLQAGAHEPRPIPSAFNH